MIEKSLYAVGLLFAPLFAGYLCRKFAGIKPHVSTWIMRRYVAFLWSPLICFSMWQLESLEWRVMALPLIGVLLITSGMIFGWLATRLHGLQEQEKGVYITCAMFSNQGETFAALLCFVLLGQRGFVLAIIYGVFLSAYLSSVGFMIASHYGAKDSGSEKDMSGRLCVILPFAALIAGLLLWWIAPPPQQIKSFVNILIPISAISCLFAIGLTVHLSKIRGYLRFYPSMCAIKFLLVPLVGLGLAYAAGLHKAGDPTLWKVVFIESTAPVATSSLVLASLFKLEQQMGNSLWLVTTGVAIALTPIIFFIAGLL